MPARRPTSARFVRAAVVAAAALAAGCGGHEAPAAFERPPPSVAVVAAEASDVPVYLDEIGRCVASDVVTVAAQALGRITDVQFKDGTDVKPGDPLFTIDPRPAKARLAAANARLASAEAAVKGAAGKREGARAQAASAGASAEAAVADSTAAETEAARAREDQRRLEQTAEGAVSQQERDRVRSAAAAAASRVEAANRRAAAAAAQRAEAEASEAEAEASIASAEAAVKQAAADVDAATLDVEYCFVRSPIAGRAGRRLLDAGNVISEMGTALLSVQRYDPIHVEFTVTERDLSAVQVSLSHGALRADAWLPDEPADARQGQVTFLDNAVDGATGTVRLRASLPNADGKFWPGRFAKVRLVLQTLPKAVLVPATAPQASAMGSFVYVVKDDSTAEMRPVVLGQRQEGRVVVAKGVAAGERVITTGQIGVMPGAKVHVVEAPPGPGGAGAAGGAGR